MRNKIGYVVIFAAFLFLTAEAPSPWDIDGIVGKKAPDFSLKDLNGKKVALSSFKGKAVLINFWATWCPSCRSEMAALDRLGKDLKDKDFVVIGVSIDRSAEYVKDYLAKHRVDFVLLMDADSKVSRRFKVFSLPTSFLLDRNGAILYKFLGEEEWNSPEMRVKINKALGSQ
jgi:peroxiredoxin